MQPSPIRTILGLDAAAQAERTGIAVGRWNDLTRQWHVTPHSRTRQSESLISALVEVINNANGPVLLAVDAPLGWPAPMGAQLGSHFAGVPLSGAPNDFFRRETDRFVAARLRKHPLDVGSNLIARAAFAALHLVGTVGRRTGCRFPLAWDPGVAHSAMIEVYPASWLIVNGAPTTAYKKPHERETRETILGKLLETGLAIDSPDLALENADILDATITVQLGVEFLEGRCLPPLNRETARREGWIWIPDRRYTSDT